MTNASGSTNKQYFRPISYASYPTLNANRASNLFSDTTGTLLASKDVSDVKKTAKDLKLNAKSATASNPLATAAASTLSYAGSVWNYVSSDQSNKIDNLAKKQEVEKRVKEFALSMGQTNITNIMVKPSKAPTLVVMGTEEQSQGVSFWSVGTDISWDSDYNGKKIHSDNSVTINIGGYARLGIPYLNIKPAINSTKKGELNIDGSKKKPERSMKPPSIQAVLRGGLGEAIIKGKISSKTVFNLDMNTGFSIGLRPVSLKGVIDLNHARKVIQNKSINFGFDFSAYASLGPFRAGLYYEAFRVAPGRNLDVRDPLNISLTPEAFEAVSKILPSSIVHAGAITGRAAATKLNTSLAVKGAGKGIKLLGVGLEKIIPTLGARAIGISAGEYVAALAGPIGWLVAGGFLAWDLYRWNEEKKAAYKAKIQDLVKIKAFRGPEGIVAALGGIVKANKFEVGSVAKMISDTIDEAYKQGLVNVPALRQEWSKMLNFKGENLIQTQLGRLVAACVLGRKDIINDITQQLMPRDRSGNVVHTDESALQDKLDNSNIVMSVENPDKLKSLMMDEVTKPNTAPYKRIGSSYKKDKSPYKKIEMQLNGDTVSANPLTVDDRGTGKWEVALITKDGLKAKVIVSMTGQLTQKQLAIGEATRRGLENIIQAQRAKFAKVPAYIKPWQAILYGSRIVATPLYMLPDGSIMWKLNTKSKAGKSIEIYESLGLLNQAGYQFDKSDMQEGHIFKIRLDNILSGKEKQ